MRQHFWGFALGFSTLLFFLSACDRSPTSSTEEISEEISEVDVTFIRKTKVSDELESAKSKSTSRDESPYSCLISTLTNDEAKHNYDNRSFWIHFPEAAVKEANGNSIFKAFTLTDKNIGPRAGQWNGVDNVIRVAQCVIPDSELAEVLLEKELKKFGKDTWLESKVKSSKYQNMVQSVTSNGEWVCVTELVITICEMDYDTGELYDCVPLNGGTFCIEYTYVEEDDSAGGGGPGFPSENPGECDPTGIEPCLEDGGTGIPPPEPDPCKEHPAGDPDRPVYCDKPCPEEDEILKLFSETQVLQNLWEESFGKIINGNLPPQDQRTERGGWLVEENGKLTFKYFPEGTDASFCSSGKPPDPPNGAIAVIHTHPIMPDEMIKVPCYLELFFETYNITDPDERAEYYESGVPAGQGTSSGDLLYAVEHGITSYYMDGETVMKYYDGSTKELVHEPEDRCGF